MPKNRLMALTALAALGVVGCGGGSSNKALSYSDFGKQANEICKSENVKVKAAGAKLTGEAANDAPVYADLIPKLQAATDRIRGLKPPTELKATFDEFNTLTDQQIALAKEAETAAKGGDQAAYQAVLAKAKPIGQQSDLAASKLGAVECTK